MNYKKIIFTLSMGILLSQGENMNAQTQTFNYTGSTATWTVPCGVSAITVDVRGAQGGTYGGATGGLGARMQGVVAVTPAEVLTIWVGGQGTPSENAGGGGGGSGIIYGVTPLVIAGGGGGCSEDGVNGLPGLTTTAGGNSSGLGGTGGYGGEKGYTSGDCGWSGGGGGFYGDGYGGSGAWDGGALPGTLSGPSAGKSALNGGTGGVGGSCGFSALGTGGWGCGGGARGEYGGGGGGGYSGGGGGQYTPTPSLSPGGGGGSYSIASPQTNTQGYQSGNGLVTFSYTIVPVPVTVTGNVIASEITCNGSTGIISAIATGQELTYSWAPIGQSTDTVTGLSAGTYTITVSSPCGGSASATAVVTQPPNVISASATVISNVFCHGGSDGSATATIAGAGTPYTYLWTPSGETIGTATGLTAGSYTVQTYNVCGASATATVTVTQPAALSITANVTANISCNGGNNGSVGTITHSGTSPYTYAWSPTGGNLDTASGLVAGSYTILLTDNNGCTGSANATVTQPNVLTTTDTVINNVLCHGNGSGNILTMPNGGTSPYAYVWTGGETSADATGLTVGTYSVNVTDVNGCTASATSSLTQPTALIVIENTTYDSIGRCTGSAWVMASGGIYPYTYSWSNGNTTYYLHYVCHDTFCYHVTDNHGCVDSGCVVVPTDLGISNISSGANKVTIYPNPNNGIFTIQAYSQQLLTNSRIEIYNVLGEEVYSRLADNNTQETINLSGQPQGIYLYRVISSEDGNLLGEGKIIIDK